MKTYRIATIPGDGIGKEVVPAGQRVLEAIAARSDSRFSGYFHSLCAELDIQTEKTA